MNSFTSLLPVLLLLAAPPWLAAAEPPAINPFGPTGPANQQTYPGYVELSDGTIQVGRVHLTRGKLLEIFDRESQRRRAIPLSEVDRIECRVLREWLEKEWRFKQSASGEKVFTGRTYPAREYRHQVTLHDGQEITGDLSGILYLKPAVDTAAATTPKSEKHILHKRHKGEVGGTLDALVFVRFVRLGNAALAEGRRKLNAQPANTDSP